jgi:hypothetical protein
MANKERGEVSITLGEVEYTLRPTWEALAEMETRAGHGIMTLARRFLHEREGGTGDYTTRDITAILTAGIKAGGGEVPLHLGKLIFQAGVVSVAPIVGAFLIGALAGGQTGNAEAPPAPQASTPGGA